MSGVGVIRPPRAEHPTSVPLQEHAESGSLQLCTQRGRLDMPDARVVEYALDPYGVLERLPALLDTTIDDSRSGVADVVAVLPLRVEYARPDDEMSSSA